MERRREAGKIGERASAILGEIVWLMSRSPTHRHLTLADMDWLVVPALINRQFKLYKLDGKPFAYASWAFLTPEVARRMAGGGARLSSGEWRCGEEAWLMDLVAPFGGGEGVKKEMKARGFAEMLLDSTSTREVAE